MHYYQFNIKDWAQATAHLTVVEEGVYRRLLDHYYETESPIPLETQWVIRRLRLGNHGAELDVILSEFFVKTDDGYRHRRCDEVICAYHSKAESNRKNGKKGGRPKKTDPQMSDNAGATDQEKPNGLFVGCQDEPKTNPNITLTINHKPITKNQEPIEDQKPLSPKATPAKKKAQIPDPFMLTSAMRTWATEHAPGVNIKTETESFVDYWRGEAKTKADWPATWRNWIRRAQGDLNSGSRRGSGVATSKQEMIEAANNRVIEEIISRHSAGDTPFIDTGELVAVDGEVIHAI